MTLAILGGPPTIDRPGVIGNTVAFTPEDRDAAIRFMYSRSGRLSFYGREGLLGRYEDELAAYHGVRHAVLTNSGTSALYSAYFGLGLEPGDEVIAPTYTYLATVTPLVGLGVVPVLADADPETGNLDPDDVRRRITDATRAIVVTHQWGHPVEMDEIMQLATDRGLRVLEDTSLAVGATYRGRRVGSIGHVAAFSLGSSKLLSGGQGGALVTDDDEIMERANLVGHFARRSREQVRSETYLPFVDTGYGHNFRMHALAVAISYRRFRRIDELIGRRARCYQALTRQLEGSSLLRPPLTRPHVTRGSWLGYTADYDAAAAGVDIDTFAKALQAEGLLVLPRSYHPLLHRTALFNRRDDGYRRKGPFTPGKRVYAEGDFPAAEAHVDRQLAFPHFLDEEEWIIEAYGAAVRKVENEIEALAAWQRRQPAG
ncbi:DegT/DnrJ/EryC1/StrS family aminotransferase [Streptomyces hoynatensis]|nr:DegT/DnrJ/EryC1/StrS family aminotransferase [Streptomyces hoynatensis]